MLEQALAGAAVKLAPWWIRWPLQLLGGIGKALRAVARWAWEHPWQTSTIAALLAFAWAWHGWDGALAWGKRQQQAAQQWKILFVDQKGEALRFVDHVRDARKMAAQLDAANVARVKREGETNLKRITHALKTDRDAALADLRRRMQPGGSVRSAVVKFGGDGGEAQLSVISEMSDGQGGTLRAGDYAIVSQADALICDANSIRLDKIITAWDAQAAIEVNRSDQQPSQ